MSVESTAPRATPLARAIDAGFALAVVTTAGVLGWVAVALVLSATVESRVPIDLAVAGSGALLFGPATALAAFVVGAVAWGRGTTAPPDLVGGARRGAAVLVASVPLGGAATVALQRAVIAATGEFEWVHADSRSIATVTAVALAYAALVGAIGGRAYESHRHGRLASGSDGTAGRVPSGRRSVGERERERGPSTLFRTWWTERPGLVDPGLVLAGAAYAALVCRFALGFALAPGATEHPFGPSFGVLALPLWPVASLDVWIAAGSVVAAAIVGPRIWRRFAATPSPARGASLGAVTLVTSVLLGALPLAALWVLGGGPAHEFATSATGGSAQSLVLLAGYVAPFGALAGWWYERRRLDADAVADRPAAVDRTVE